MKKLLLLLFLSPLFSFSQDTIKIPTHAAKSIVKDLIGYEGAKKELDLCNDHVKLLEKKVSSKDSIIAVFLQKEENYKLQIQAEKDKIAVHEQMYDELKKEHKKLKRKLFFNQIGSGAIIGFLAYLLIAK